MEKEKVPSRGRFCRQFPRFGHELLIDQAIDEGMVVGPIQMLQAHPVAVRPTGRTGR